MNKFSTHKRLSTTTDVLAFIEELKATKLIVEVDEDNNVELVCHSYDEKGSLLDDDIVIADFIEPRIVEFKRDNQPTVYVECSLDYGNGLEVEEDIMAEIPTMKLRVYSVALINGAVMRFSPDDELMIDLRAADSLHWMKRDEERIHESIEESDMQDSDSDDCAIIVRFSKLNYQVIAY